MVVVFSCILGRENGVGGTGGEGQGRGGGDHCTTSQID